MYRGTNPTALKSQQWLKEAFFDLLKEMPYNKINVKNISEKADLARQTFYKLYNSKEEIVEHLLDEMFEKFKSNLFEHDPITLEIISYGYFEYFYQNKEFVYLITDNNLTNLLEKKFSDYLDELQLLVSDKEKKYTQYIKSMISGALLGILIQWFKDDLALPIDELSQLVTDIFRGNVTFNT